MFNYYWGLILHFYWAIFGNFKGHHFYLISWDQVIWLDIGYITRNSQDWNLTRGIMWTIYSYKSTSSFLNSIFQMNHWWYMTVKRCINVEPNRVDTKRPRSFRKQFESQIWIPPNDSSSEHTKCLLDDEIHSSGPSFQGLGDLNVGSLELHRNNNHS